MTSMESPPALPQRYQVSQPSEACQAGSPVRRAQSCVAEALGGNVLRNGCTFLWLTDESSFPSSSGHVFKFEAQHREELLLYFCVLMPSSVAVRQPLDQRPVAAMVSSTFKGHHLQNSFSIVRKVWLAFSEHLRCARHHLKYCTVRF